MSDAAQSSDEKTEKKAAPAAGLPAITLHRARVQIDFITILGMASAVGLIIAAIVSGGSASSFFNIPAFMIVIFGTMAATAISYTASELAKAGSIIGKSLFRRIQSPSRLAISLMDFAVVARKKGVLALGQFDVELRKDPFVAKSLQLVVDGYTPQYIEHILQQEIDSLNERHKRSAGITRRASEVAPAMGLIGTLVGLVQMLANLENPETIGPAMAVALLTTFYGAILGTVIMAPLAVKLEKNSADETLVKILVKNAAVSIAKQENPRQLEMLLNSELPPSERIRYFK